MDATSTVPHRYIVTGELERPLILAHRPVDTAGRGEKQMTQVSFHGVTTDFHGVVRRVMGVWRSMPHQAKMAQSVSGDFEIDRVVSGAFVAHRHQETGKYAWKLVLQVNPHIAGLSVAEQERAELHLAYVKRKILKKVQVSIVEDKRC